MSSVCLVAVTVAVSYAQDTQIPMELPSPASSQNLADPSGSSSMASSGDLVSMSLEELLGLRVETATLREQSLQEAPASVTVITAAEIDRYGYRTLGEVLSNVRSFYLTSDGPLGYVGARGFSLPGDYNTRFLVMINGHAMTDNVYSAMYFFGQDFPLDPDLIEQIEIVRGPSSSLYGGNGLFATINIITRSPASYPGKRASLQSSTLGEQKLIASSAFSVGSNADMLISASAIYASGRTVEFSELAEEGISPSQTDGVGAESGYHLFANLTWNNWSVMALLGQRKATVPSGWFGTEVGNKGTIDVESRNFLEARWGRRIGENSELQWRTYYDQFRYDATYDYGENYRYLDGAAGDWIGSKLTFHYSTSSRGTLTVGLQGNYEIRNVQYGQEVYGPVEDRNASEPFRASYPRHSLGLFVQQEFKLAPDWTFYAGGRLDDTTYDHRFFSPRLALVYKRNNTAYKLMYGRAFRNPSTFERYYIPNPAVAAEHIDTFEIAREQQLFGRMNLITSVFHYRLANLIVLDEDSYQYVNDSRTRATGVDVELNGQPASWLETTASLSLQRTRAANASERLQNSPARLGQLRATVPLFRQRFKLSGAARYLSSRLDGIGEIVPAVTLVDLTFTAARLRSGLQFQAGVRNLMDRRYDDPLSNEHATSRMPGAGRSFFVRLTWSQD